MPQSHGERIYYDLRGCGDFARKLVEMGSMDERYFDNFQAPFKIMTAYLISPDLLIYLRASVPVHRMESLSRIECRLFGLFPE